MLSGGHVPGDHDDPDDGENGDTDAHGEARDDGDRQGAEPGDRRDGDGLGATRHAQPSAVVAHHLTDARESQHPALEPRARPREACRGTDEEDRRRQPRDDDADATESHAAEAGEQPQEPGQPPHLRAPARRWGGCVLSEGYDVRTHFVTHLVEDPPSHFFYLMVD